MMADGRLTIYVLAALLAGPACAQQATSPMEDSMERLAIGSTGITCLKAPCPWRGVVRLDDARRDPLRPFWSGERLPRLDAAPGDAARIEAAWDAMECLEIEGMLADDAGRSGPPSIRVGRIVGDCP